MHQIILLSSFHIALGKCNTNELYNIIKDIQPEIIFEELPPQIFHTVYADRFTPQSLEAFTIKRYLKKYPIKHFPVDTYPVHQGHFFSGADVILNTSSEYGALWNENVSMINQNGYSFLNSNHCIELLDKIRTVEEATLLQINNERLSREYRLERELHDKRENEMLQNIYKCSKQYPYEKALFICGVDHRKPLMKKIQEKNTENITLNWRFYGTENE